MEILVLVLSFIILIGIGVPIAWSIGISSILTMLVSIPFIPAFTTVAQRMATGLDSFALLAIPFFILAGHIMNRGGIARRLINITQNTVWDLAGSPYVLTQNISVSNGAVSGSGRAASGCTGLCLHLRPAPISRGAAL